MTDAQTFLNSSLPLEKELLSFYNKNDKLILFEIGSYDATDAIRYSRLFPNASVYTFEPVPQNFAKVKTNLATFPGNIQAFELAFSNTVGSTQMHVSTLPGNSDIIPEVGKSSSLMEPDQHLNIYPNMKFNTTIDVKTDTIQHFCETNGVERIDFIHVDTQGAEKMVLDGAGEFLQKINMIWLEVEQVKLYKNQPLHKDIERYMRERDFVLARYDFRFVSGDQLYIHKNFLISKRGAAGYRVARWKEVFVKNIIIIPYFKLLGRRVKRIFASRAQSL